VEEAEANDVQVGVQPLPALGPGGVHHVMPPLPGTKDMGGEAGSGGDEANRVAGDGIRCAHERTVTNCLSRVKENI
jgi:hypothetical protein